MKKQVTRIANFFAFNLLFFALYLNFVHKDHNTPVNTNTAAAHSAVQGNVLVENPDQYLNRADVKVVSNHITSTPTQQNQDKTAALKLSIN